MCSDLKKKPVRKFGEAAYILGTALCAFGVSFSAKSGLGVSTVVAPAFVLSAFLEPINGFFTFGNVEYVLQGALLITLAIVLRRLKISYPLSFLTAVFYGLTLDAFRLLVGTDIADELWLKIIYAVVGALTTELSIALILRSYLPQQAYDFSVKEISVVKGKNLGKVKWIYDVSSLAVAIALMLVFFGEFRFSLIGVGTLVLAFVNAPMISILGKLIDRFIDFSPLFLRFAERFFKSE